MVKATRERWLNLCQRIGAKDNPKTIKKVGGTYDELIATYTGADRHYHDINHINDCLDKLDESYHLAESPDVLEMAWWWHDFIYDTKSMANEYNSAVAADGILFQLGLTVAVRNKIDWLIMATKHDLIPANLDQRLIIDIDLASLAASTEIFDKNTADIRKEHHMYTDEEFQIGRAKFFEKFLQGRPSIYMTDYFRDKYEAQAQANIKRALEILNG